MASIFRLKQFPNVCRLCLKELNSQPMHSETIVSISQTDPVFGGKSINEYIAALTFHPISEENNDFLPRMVCIPCLDQLRTFAKYYSKICIIQQLMNSLAELERSNSIPLVNLFHYRSDLLRIVIKDLSLCTTDNYSVEDLWKEFPRYTQTSPPAVQSKEHAHDKAIQATNTWKDGSNNSDATNAEECTPDEVINLTVDRSTTDSVDGGSNFKKLKSPKKSNYEPDRIDSPPHVKQETLRYPCHQPDCAEIFENNSMYLHHMSSVHKMFICEICQFCRLYISENDLAKHKEHHHLKDLKYECQSCGISHNTRLLLRNHIRNFHLKVSNCSFLCEHCGLKCEDQTFLTAHMLEHSNEQNVVCERCGKKFLNVVNLRNHITNIHEGIRLKCSYCFKTFPTRYNLISHIERVHEIRRRFACDVCLQYFDNQEKLDNHKERHKAPKTLE